MAINSVRFDSIFKTLSSTVQKVYSAVPIQCAWNKHQIHDELIRKNMASTLSHTTGCLNQLVVSGLIAESSRGYFVRIEIRGSVDKPSEKVKLNSFNDFLPMNTPVPKTEPIDQLAKLATQVKDISFQLKNLANDIETAALDITEQMNNADEGTKKFKQLQALLKELT